MSVYRVVIEVRRVYTVEIAAYDQKEAISIANNLPSTEVEAKGELDEVETDVIIAFPPQI